MSSRPGHWLAALRRRKRGVLLALLPAVLLWTGSGAACLTMLAAAAPAATAAVAPHTAPADHAAAHHHSEHAAPAARQPVPTHDCPHCPPHDGAVVAHDTCAATAAVQAERATPHGGIALTALHPVAALVVARAPPPLRLGPPGADPPQPHVPLNLRHCVLLI